MSDATLLVELQTEELPPKSLKQLADAFGWNLYSDLKADHLLADDSTATIYATPRRIAVSISNVREVAPDFEVVVKGPAVKSGLDGSGNPTKALLGFANKRGVTVDKLVRVNDGKQEVFAHRDLAKGGQLDINFELRVEEALRRLPVPKMMRWGAGDAAFVRPVHGLVMLHGTRRVPGTVLGVKSGKISRGHRFMGRSEITLENADAYEATLLGEGMVMADFSKRKSEIDRQLIAQAHHYGAGLGDYQSLLDEVTALVEHPNVYVGEFDKAFLEVPQECLILTMRQNQKYFPLFDAAGKLTGRFLIVSNMQVADARHIVDGNQRVVRPRLEDARFFYNQDRKVRLEERVPQLEKVVYHNKIGNQLQRVERIQLLAGKIARELKSDAGLAERAAWLAKADLLSGMVGEFPELQGTMGRYYALHDREPDAVADAIEAHYRPRYAGDRLPEGPIAYSVALADKLDALAGMFGIGQQPTGDKDPFGLRRAALGAVRILVEKSLPLSLNRLVNAAFDGFSRSIGDAHTDLETFIYERFSSYLRELGFTALQIDSVLAGRPTSLHKVLQQLEAVKAFQTLPEAESLAAANKRIVNILKQAEAKGESFANAELGELKDPAERALHDAIHAASEKAKPLYENGDYTGYLQAFAVLKIPVDTFFEKVMVMVEDKKLRHQRLALLKDLRDAMNRVADISRLAT